MEVNPNRRELFLKPGVLITDFDGTITVHDFFFLVRDYMPCGEPEYLDEYRAGRITHFEAMARYFAHAPTSDAELAALMDRTEPDPRLAAAVASLAGNGWDLTVVSAGSSWYIERILARAGVRASVHANPGRIEQGRGLVLELPRDSPYFCAKTGVDKAAVVRDALAAYERVAFAGDGPQDLAPALLVDSELRFARGFLARKLESLGEGYQPFDRWSGIVDAIFSGPPHSRAKS